MLKAAEAWGTPPWVLAEDDDTLLWLKRWQIYNRVISDAAKEKASING